MSGKLDLSKGFIGRRALVAGGSRGIGSAIAQRLLDAGAKVAITARSSSDVTPTAATFISGDVRTNEGVKAVQQRRSHLWTEETMQGLGRHAAKRITQRR